VVTFAARRPGANEREFRCQDLALAVDNYRLNR
jgi:hypothetical protein